MRFALNVSILCALSLAGISLARGQEAKVPSLGEVAAVKIFHVSGPEREQVCEPVLGSVAWWGRTLDGGDFLSIFPLSIHTPNSVDLDEVEADFFGTGTPVPIFVITRTIVNSGYTWIVVPDPGDVDRVRARLKDAQSKSSYDAELAAVLDEMTHVGFGPGGASGPASSSARNPAFAARLYDASNTELFQGEGVVPMLIRGPGRIYIAAIRDWNGRRGPTAAVFRPEPDGRLVPLCAAHIPHSRDGFVPKLQRKGSVACPAHVGADGELIENKKTELSWEKLPGGPYHDAAFAKLPGSSDYVVVLRFEHDDKVYSVHFRLDEGGIRQLKENIDRNKDVFSGVSEKRIPDGESGNSSLRIYDQKPYLVDYALLLGGQEGRDEAGVYFRYLDGDKPVLVCSFSQVFMPPPGVPVAPSMFGKSKEDREAGDAVLTAGEQWAKAFNANDLHAIVMTYHGQAMLWGTLSPILREDRLGVAEYFRTVFENQPGITVAFDAQSIQVEDDVAVNSGTYTLLIPENGGIRRVPARYSFTYKRQGDGWLILSHHSSLMPGGMPASR